ncbi:MAG: hypothetical protein KKC84_05380, partial [Candidatus Omnitrophica bacterium]|nr:hypothetical protein [Candidatus Omnitrophota bacterium]
MIRLDIVAFLMVTGIAISVLLAMLVISKMSKITQLREEIDRYKKSLDEMDEQAKLIVQTDMELNKTQERLDKKLRGLYTLQRLSRAVSNALDESQVFSRIDPLHLEDLGFEKAFGLLRNAQGKFSISLCVGYTQEVAQEIQESARVVQELFTYLTSQNKTISSASLHYNPLLRDRIIDSFQVVSFIAAPLLPHEGDKGILLVGTENKESSLNKGDEELITILANQLGQALENARLFEKTWRAQQELEKKVEERTRQLREAFEEVKSINKRKSDFISSVSHELRTPLTSIKGYAAILLTEKLGKIPEE